VDRRLRTKSSREIKDPIESKPIRRNRDYWPFYYCSKNQTHIEGGVIKKKELAFVSCGSVHIIATFSSCAEGNHNVRE
jgi:hypothetical protein